MRFTTLLALLALTSFSAYAETPENPYTKNYTARAGVQQPAAPSAAPKAFRGGNREADYQRLLEDGYDMLGSSSFQNADVDPQMFVELAKKVGADLALVYPTSLTEVPAALKLQQAKARTKAEAKTRKEMEGEEFRIEKDAPTGELIGLVSHFYEYYATYWVKLPAPLLGLHVNEQPASEEAPGLPIVAVIKGSPAAAADLRKGDIVLKIGEVETKTGDALVKEVHANAGKKIEITFLRDDRLMQVDVQLNAR